MELLETHYDGVSYPCSPTPLWPCTLTLVQGLNPGPYFGISSSHQQEEYKKASFGLSQVSFPAISKLLVCSGALAVLLGPSGFLSCPHFYLALGPEFLHPDLHSFCGQVLVRHLPLDQLPDC